MDDDVDVDVDVDDVKEVAMSRLLNERLYSVWVTTLHNLSDKTPHKVWDTTIRK